MPLNSGASNNAIHVPIDTYRKMSEDYKRAIEVQDASLESLRNCQSQIAKCEEIGGAVIVNLVQQTERLTAANEEAKKLSHQIKRARREVVSFFRTIATDKCMIVLAVVVVLAIIVIVLKLTVWK